MSGRLQKLAESLPGAGVDVLLVSDLVNVRYLTGYTGSNGIALIGADTRVFVTDFRYVEQAAEQVDPTVERRQAQLELLEAVPEALPAGPLRLGFDDVNMSVRRHGKLRKLLADEVSLLPAGGVVEALRAVKDPDELARIRAASAIADAAYEHIVSAGLIGRTERQIAMALEQEMRMRGAQRPSFDTIVAAGPHGALPHASPRDVEVAPGDVVVIDWGAELDGYCSDCTRTVAAGEAGERAREVYELVLEAQLAGLGAVRAGAGGKDVDAVARELIAQAGHGEHFGHGLGHGVGMAVHEAPRLGQRSTDELLDGNVVTVEPGVYLPGEFGVRIEDLVVVSDGGCEILTGIDKALRVVG